MCFIIARRDIPSGPAYVARQNARVLKTSSRLWAGTLLALSRSEFSMSPMCASMCVSNSSDVLLDYASYYTESR